jgi:hypothetical protein
MQARAHARRLWHAADYVEMEWTAGPLSQPYDVCLSVETDLDSGVASDMLTAAEQLLVELHEANLHVCHSRTAQSLTLM